MWELDYEIRPAQIFISKTSSVEIIQIMDKTMEKQISFSLGLFHKGNQAKRKASQIVSKPTAQERHHMIRLGLCKYPPPNLSNDINPSSLYQKWE